MLPSCDLGEVASPLCVLIFSPEAHECKAESLAQQGLHKKQLFPSSLTISFYRQGNEGPGRKHDLPKATQPIGGRAGIQPLTFGMCP